MPRNHTRLVAAAAILFALVALPTPAQSPAKDPALWKRAQKIHAAAIVVDTHNDVTSRILDDNFDMGARAKDGHTDIPRMKEGGLDAEFFAIYVDKKYVAEGGSARRALDMIDIVYEQVARHPESLEMAYTVADIRRITKKGKIAALMGIEGGHAIEDSLFALREFYRLGIRYMTLTHTNTNNWADSSGSFGAKVPDKKRWGGLNDFGREVVREMNRIGMMVDLSHVSDETFADAIEVTQAPVILSHSCCRALCNHTRNIDDDMLRALAKNGGVIQINFYETFLDQRRVDASAKFRAELDAIQEQYKNDEIGMYRAYEEFERTRIPRTPLSVLIDHIDHVVKIAGIDHVGLGSDFDGGISLPEGLADASELPNLTYELLKRGYSDADVRKILGENTLRVMRECEVVAARLQREQPVPKRVKNEGR
jgi:membrane dipeptidase